MDEWLSAPEEEEEHPDEASRWEERQEEIEVTEPYGEQYDDE